MKKLLLLVFTLALAAGLCGCEKGLAPMQLRAGLCGCEKVLAPMQLRAAPVSEETRQVLELTDNELTLWEYRTDGGTYDITMNFWVCRDGSWEKAQFYPGAAASEGRFGVHVTSTRVEYITLAEDGTCGYSSLTGESMIEPGREIPLLARLGWDESSDPVPTDWQNFQDSGCDTGVAITVIFTETAES